MKKELNAQNETIGTIETIRTLREAMTLYPNVSLRKLAISTDATYNVLLKASKAPIAGVPYDPTAINYEEVEKKLRAKIGNEAFEAIDWLALEDSATIVKALKDPVELGNDVALRDQTAIYTVVYKTDTHIVIMAVGSSAPRAMSNGTFEHLGGHIATNADFDAVLKYNTEQEAKAADEAIELEAEEEKDAE